ncbi:O-antigen ligase family protein [Cytobacillus oceanisediminis]|uniref:O-antigen ligase family protein n=1 Tax=Cytobacillus oceanisediminis TaxID=665099 RepID=UPI0023DA9D1C|nr:O-antigen ligase family protein [Cytobacillus oceanisediminis]MDF2037673.1 O-antigen ligase family protein [Cytobacillus oceanisediminis]
MKWKATAYIVVFALIFIDSFFFNVPIGPLRITLLRLVIGVLFIIMLDQIFLKRNPLITDHIKFPLAFLGIWFYYGALSLVWTSNKGTAVKELYYFAVFLLLIIVLIFLLQHLKSSLITKTFWISGFVLVLISVLEFKFNIHLPTSRFVIEAERFTDATASRATGFFYNENDFALYLVMIVPFYLAGLLKKPILFKLVNIGLLIAIFLITYLNDARLSVMAIVLQILLFALISFKNLIKHGTRLFLLFSPLLLLAAAGIFYYLANASLFEGIKAGQGSGFIRMNLYLSGLYASFKSFMLGVGPGNFQHHIYFNTLGFTNPHNWWLEILTNYGLFIFAGYCVFFGYILIQLYLIYWSDNKKNKLALTLFLSFIGFAIACLGPSSLFYFWPMWLLYGVTLGYIVQKRKYLRRERYPDHSLESEKG